MDKETSSNYFTVIPATVRYDKKLSDKAYRLYGEIAALTNDKGFCWAQNKYLANLLDTSQDTISRRISELVKAGHINSELIYKENSKEVELRKITLCLNLHTTNDKNADTSICKNDEDNNISNINNIRLKELICQADEIIDIFNEITSKNFKHTESNKKVIVARLKEGFTKEDFTEVIKYKYFEWADDEKMKKYIQPSTLFGTKMDGYLQCALADKVTSPKYQENW